MEVTQKQGGSGRWSWLSAACCRKEIGVSGVFLRGKSLRIIEGYTLVDYFNEGVLTKRINPNNIALIYNGNTPIKYTYAQFQDISIRLAKSIVAALSDFPWANLNEDGDTVIAFCLGNTDKLVITIFAILYLRAAYLPIDIMTPDEEIVKIYKGTKPILMIIESHAPVQTRFLCVSRVVHVVTIDELLKGAETIPSSIVINPLVNRSRDRPSGETAAIFYTAGTTNGVRKGVRIRHREVFNRICWQYAEFPYDPEDIACLTAQGVIHTSMADIFAPLLYGTPLVILNRVTCPKAPFLVQAISAWGITRISVSSIVLTSVIEAVEKSGDPLKIRQDLSSVRQWFCVGDTLTFELAERFFAALGDRQTKRNLKKLDSGNSIMYDGAASGGDGSNMEVTHLINSEAKKSRPEQAHLIHLYGTTETTADATFEVFEDLSDLLGKSNQYRIPFGRPIANTTVFVVDDHEVHPVDQTGEICVSGGCLARGYTIHKGGDDEERDFQLTSQKSKAYGFRKAVLTTDLGRISEGNDGVLRLYSEGRSGSIAKVKGHAIDVNEVANAIRSTGFVENVECVMYHGDQDGQVMVAACVLRPDVGVLDILTEIGTRLPHGALPEIFPMSEIPLLPDGRLDRRMILETYRRNLSMCRSKDWNSLGLPTSKMDAARTLCEAVAHSIGISIRHVIEHFRDSFWQLGGTSNNAVIAVCRVKARDYYLALDDFIGARSLEAIMEKMLESSSRPRTDFVKPMCTLAKAKFIVSNLMEKHRADVVRIISESYPEKNELAMCTHAEQSHFQLFLAEIFQALLKLNLSLVAVSRRNGEVVAVMLNVDSHTKLKLKRTPKSVQYIIELFNFVEVNARQKMRFASRSKIIEPYLMATSSSCKPSDNVLLFQLLLKTMIDKAKVQSYTDLFFISSVPLVRHLCRLGYKYTVLTEYQVNLFTAADKTRPFRNTGNYHKIYCFSKNLLL